MGIINRGPITSRPGQFLGPGASPVFVALTLTGLTASLPVVTNVSKVLASLAYTGTTSFRKNLGLETSDSPTFSNVNLTGTEPSLKMTDPQTGGTQYQFASGGNLGITLGDFVIQNLSDGGTPFRIKKSALSDGALVIDGQKVTLAQVNVANLSASKVMMTDGSKDLISGTNTDAEIADAVSKKHSNYLDHAAVTLAASAEVLLGLSTQELSLDNQNPNVILAGPTSGAAAAPTFRSLVGADLINIVYPVGSIYISISSTNPGTLFGVGTWVAFGAGRTLVAFDAGQVEFDVVEETGGEKTHTLSTTEIPSHRHKLGVDNGTGSDLVIQQQANRTRLIEDNANSELTGGGLTHNNLQPYIVVYMWKRTA